MIQDTRNATDLASARKDILQQIGLILLILSVIGAIMLVWRSAEVTRDSDAVMSSLGEPGPGPTPTEVIKPTSTSTPSRLPPEVVPTAMPTPMYTPELPGELPSTGGIIADPSTALLAALSPIPLPTVEARAEWPERMDFDGSDVVVVRLSQVGQKELGTVTVTPGIAPQRTEVSQKIVIACEVPAGYEGFIVANLDGAAFDISPQGAVTEPIGKIVQQPQTTWTWTITPKKPGLHRLYLSIDVVWQPAVEGNGRKIECDIWRELLTISVEKYFLTTGQLTFSSLFTTLVGSVLNVPWLYEKVVVRRKRYRGEKEGQR